MGRKRKNVDGVEGETVTPTGKTVVIKLTDEQFATLSNDAGPIPMSRYCAALLQAALREGLNHEVLFQKRD